MVKVSVRVQGTHYVHQVLVKLHVSLFIHYPIGPNRNFNNVGSITVKRKEFNSALQFYHMNSDNLCVMVICLKQVNSG